MDPYIGEIRVVGFNFPPVGWATCNGQLLPISQYQALFVLIGTIYGGDGVTTFALPDMRSRVAPHAQGAPGLTSYQLGQTGGVENVTLISSQLPAHSHTYSLPLAASTSGTLSDDPAGRRPAATTAPTYASAAQSGKTLATTAATGTITAAGGNQPHTNLQPVLAMNYIICTDGIFPQQ